MNLQHLYFENFCILRYCDGATAVNILSLAFVYKSVYPHEILCLWLDKKPFSYEMLRTLPTHLTMIYLHDWLMDNGDMDDYRQAVRWACQSGALDELRFLLSSSKGEDDDPWLIVTAAASGHAQVVDFLFSRGSLNHIPAFDYACANGHLDVIKVFIARGAVVDHSNLRSACLYGHLEVARYLISCGADARVISDCIVHWLCQRGNKEMMEYLVSQGTSISLQNAVTLGRATGWIRSIRLFAVQRKWPLLFHLTQATAVFVGTFSVTYGILELGCTSCVKIFRLFIRAGPCKR